MIETFKHRLRELNPDYCTFKSLRTLQVNLGNVCNLTCDHCHISASPVGKQIMGHEVMTKIITFLTRNPGVDLDITGGCPEMNPSFRSFIERTAGLAPRRLLRSNLTIMTETGMEWLPRFCHAQGLIIVASLPCYLAENVESQRGPGVYDASIVALKELNSLGYGDTHELNLVYNPGGDYLPGSQSELESAYRLELARRHGIRFNNLYTITNAPIGRFRGNLEKEDTMERYMKLLVSRFNPDAAHKIMCRSLVSVDWLGYLYNCDFNQAAGMPISLDDGRTLTLDDLDSALPTGFDLLFDQHCYSCTAGEGSSCTGTLI
jgi:radical SAM/Cys-rich protein